MVDAAADIAVWMITNFLIIGFGACVYCLCKL